MLEATEAIPEVVWTSLEQYISMPVMFELSLSVDFWIADIRSSNHTSQYKKEYIKISADEGGT